MTEDLCLSKQIPDEVCSIYSSEDEERNLHAKTKNFLASIGKFGIDNVSTSEEGSIYSLGSSLREFSSPMGGSFFKSKKEKIYQINRLNGEVVFLNVFDLRPWITEADLVRFYSPLQIESLVKYPNPTMLDLEFASKEDAIEAIIKEPRVINGCRFDIRISKRNYNRSYFSDKKRRFDLNKRVYEKKGQREEESCCQAYREGGNVLVTYTQKPKIQTEERIEDSERKEIENQIQEDKSESLTSVENKEAETIKENKSVTKIEDNKNEIIQRKNISLPSSGKKSSSGSGVKVGKYRNLIKVGDKLRKMVIEPSEEENEVQKQREQEIARERLEKEQREKEEQEKEIARQNAEKEREEEAKKKKEEEEKQECLKVEESAKNKIEYVIYKQDYPAYERRERYDNFYQRKWNDYRGSYNQRDGYYRNHYDSYKHYRSEYAQKQYIQKTEAQQKKSSEEYIQLGNFRILKDNMGNNGLTIMKIPSLEENKQGEKAL